MVRRRNRMARWMARGLESAICLAISRVGVYHANGEFAAGEPAHVIRTELLAESPVRLGRDLSTAPARLKMPPKQCLVAQHRLMDGPDLGAVSTLGLTCKLARFRKGAHSGVNGSRRRILAAMRRLHLIGVALSEEVIRRDRVLLLRLLRDDTRPHGGRQNVSV
ncbi:hypothetical protein LR48_Vigan08g017600 [Vigna angularis]|uniref:Uncharacterized protein n=1 Tax=Phaseolus angularis TaxID=3914 RepID=A0A0L9V3N1_PHAAN|nr:hypothetical protein LR48_Vigan08g017600 [Vigna angularis]